MDFLDYSSDSEEGDQDGEQEVQKHNSVSNISTVPQAGPTTSSPIATKMHGPSSLPSLPSKTPVVHPNFRSASENSTAKKKKTLDISFLPQEIQDALLKGVDDSDSEDEKQRGNNTQMSSDKLPPGSDPLLSLLPPPKSSPKASSSNKPSMLSSSSVSSSTVPSSSSSGEHGLKQSYISSSQHGISSLLSKSVSASSVDSDSVGFPFSSAVPLSITSNTASKANITMLINPNFNYHDSDEEEPDDRANSRARIQQSSSSSSSASAYSASLFDDNSSSLSKQEQFLQKRKREREIEHSLLAGDTSLLDDDNIASEVTLRDVIAPSLSWDALGYAAKQEQEQAIINKYTGDGNVKGMMQPNKLQNRRHQLSSLALKAAETEIALIDAKTIKTKSKRQTQAKYGW
jgi:hypothetical protein